MNNSAIENMSSKELRKYCRALRKRHRKQTKELKSLIAECQMLHDSLEILKRQYEGSCKRGRNLARFIAGEQMPFAPYYVPTVEECIQQRKRKMPIDREAFMTYLKTARF